VRNSPQGIRRLEGTAGGSVIGQIADQESVIRLARTAARESSITVRCRSQPQSCDSSSNALPCVLIPKRDRADPISPMATQGPIIRFKDAGRTEESFYSNVPKRLARARPRHLESCMQPIHFRTIIDRMDSLKNRATIIPLKMKHDDASELGFSNCCVVATQRGSRGEAASSSTSTNS
jgi:hypothetical protein